MADLEAATFRFRDARQERVYRRLLLIGPGPAAFFRDACMIVAAPGALDAETHLVAHLMRDTESAIRDVLETVSEREERLQATEPRERDHHRREVQAVLAALGIEAAEPAAKAWMDLVDRGLHSLAHRQNLERPRPMDADFEQTWGQFQLVLDAVLDRFEAVHYRYMEKLDELLALPSPSKSAAQQLLVHMPNNLVALGYFFERLADPAWLEPLAAEGAFAHPPGPEPDSEGRGARLPGWPALGYLVRLAPDPCVAEAIARIAQGIPATENARVNDGIADIALALPVDLGASLLPRLEAALGGPYRIQLPRKLGSLAQRLVERGLEQEGLGLLAKVLAVRVEERRLHADGEEQGSVYRDVVPLHADLWDYQEILEHNMLPIAHAAPTPTLDVLASLLADALGETRRSQHDEAPIREDWSYYWCVAVEPAGSERSHDLEETLAFAVRDAALAVVEASDNSVRDVVEYLRARRFRILHRIALNVLSCFPAESPDLVEQAATDRALFDDEGMAQEYGRLLERCFPLLSEAARETLLEWIDAGPPDTELGAA